MNFKTIQFDILVETELKGKKASIMLSFFFGVNLKESSKFDENFGKKSKYFGKE